MKSADKPNNPPKKRPPFGPRGKAKYRPPPRLSAEQLQRKVDAFMEFIKPDEKK